MRIRLTVIKAITFLLVVLPLSAQAIIIDLSGNLSPANQDGSDPSLVTDPNGVIPSSAFGSVDVQLDTVANTLDFQISVSGIVQTDLRDFGPNSTPIHLHLASGNPGNFGPIAIDLALGSTAADFTDTLTGFTFSRTGVSILLADQGSVTLGMHPGDNLIIDSILSGDMFVLVHTNNSNITGFPFGEIRGNISVVPIPTTLLLLITGLFVTAGISRR